MNRLKAVQAFRLCAFAATMFAQTPQPDGVVSPEVRPDRTVIFRLRAPKATEVSVYGDWMPVGKPEPMTKGADGVWSTSVGPLDATGHLYWFNVDGLAIADPINPRVKLRQRTSASLVEVPAEARAPWDVRDVPHGSVVVDYAKSQVLNRTERTVVYLGLREVLSSLSCFVLAAWERRCSGLMDQCR